MAGDLSVYQDGNRRNLMDWIRELGENIYTGIGQRTWRVPPVKFHVQKLSEQKLNKKENDSQNVRIEGRILGQPNVTDQETNRAENLVCGAFESLSDSIVQSGLGPAMFLISNFEYDNYLNKLSEIVTKQQPQETSQNNNNTVEKLDNSEASQADKTEVKLPKHVAKRGELDILILHQEAGVILVQTKAVGYNFFDKSSQFERSNSVQTAVEKAGEQLNRDRNVLLYIMDDLGLTNEQITSVVALPNLPRSILLEELSSEMKQKVCNEFKLSLDTNFLCEEDFKLDMDGCHKALATWWTQTILPMAKKLSLSSMQQIAYRTVGLLSTVSVWSYAQPRIEVRNWNEAAWETGNRYTQVVLSPTQVELLKHEEQYLYLWGPAGSGKTLLLSLKGRQWLRKDCNVAILNTRLGSRGRTVGQVIEATINKTEGLKKNVVRIDLDLMDSEEVLSSIVASHVKDQTFNFLLDEVAWVKETEKLLQLLKKRYPYSSIWCAGMLVECQPEGFDSARLQVILRCPPSVQRVLRIVDNRNERYDLYNLDSAKAGLPTDGLPAHFIIHSRHGDSSVQPYDCSTCARELSDFLTKKLNMKSIDRRHSSHENIMTVYEQQSKLACSKPISVDPKCKTDATFLGSSIGSDSGCDVGYNVKENIAEDEVSNLDELEPESCGLEKDKTGHKKSHKKKKKKKANSLLENINPNEKVQTGSYVKNVTPGLVTSSDVEKCDKSTLMKPSAKSEVHTSNSASRHKNSCAKASNRNQNSTTINENENSTETPAKNKNNLTIGDAVASKKTTKKSKRNNPKLNSSLDGNTYPKLNFSDAVLPVTVPRAWHHYNKRGYWSISREALAQEMVLLGSSAFCQELYYSGVPLKVEEAMVMKAEGKDLENNFVLCPVGAVHGLEYKLVVCVPSACELTEYIELSQGIRYGEMDPKILMKRTKFGTDFVKRQNDLARDKHCPSEPNVNNLPKIDKVRISTHVAEEGAPYDMLYEPVYDCAAHLIPKEKMQPVKYPAKEYVPPTYTDAEIQVFKNVLCGQCMDRNKCVCQYFKADELAALYRLDDWDKAYVLMCASRCTSMLVLVLP